MRHPLPSPAVFLVWLAVLAAVAASPAITAGRPRGGNPAAATGASRERSAPLLDGELSIVAAGRAGPSDTSRVPAALDFAFAEAGRLAGVFAPGGETSELARLNGAAADRNFACSDDLYAALEDAVTLAAETDGAYDPTDRPLRRAREARGGAAALDVAAARRVTGWRMLTLDPGTRSARFARAGVEVELDGIARGCLLESAARQLREHGIVRGRLELGGDVLAFTSGDPWPVTVRAPDGSGRAAVTLIVADAAVATAGPDAERGARTFDPRTGQSIPDQVSVTVVERSARLAAARAGALRVMGRDGALAYARVHPDLGLLWLEYDGSDVRGWSWNLGRMVPAPDLRIEWMTEP